MKPKNRVYCYGCQKSKMLFDTKKKADNFIQFNKEGILEENGKAPVRSYYCELCGGYHVTSSRSKAKGEKMDERDQTIVRTLNNYCNWETNYASMIDTITKKLKAAEAKMENFDFRDIQLLYDEFQMEQNTLLKMPLKIRTKFASLLYKIKTLTEISIQVEELIHLPLEEIIKKTNYIKPTKKEQKIVSLLKKKIKEYRLALKLNQLESLPTPEEIYPVNDKSEYKKSVLAILERIEQAKKAFENGDVDKSRDQLEIAEYLLQELAVEDENTTLLKKQIKEYILTQKLSQLEPLPTPEEIYPVNDKSEYKESVLAILERIEQAKKAFENGDVDESSDQLEIAEYLLQELAVEDENTTLLKKQLEIWKTRISNYE